MTDDGQTDLVERSFNWGIGAIRDLAGYVEEGVGLLVDSAARVVDDVLDAMPTPVKAAIVGGAVGAHALLGPGIPVPGVGTVAGVVDEYVSPEGEPIVNGVAVGFCSNGRNPWGGGVVVGVDRLGPTFEFAVDGNGLGDGLGGEISDLGVSGNVQDGNCNPGTGRIGIDRG